MRKKSLSVFGFRHANGELKIKIEYFSTITLRLFGLQNVVFIFMHVSNYEIQARVGI